MKINAANVTAINEAIAAVQGPRCTVRTIDANHIARDIKLIEDRLSGLLAKKDWQGLEFVCEPHAQSFSGAYKGTPESTGFTLTRGATGWFVTGIYRGRCPGPNLRIVANNLATKAATMVSYVVDHF